MAIIVRFLSHLILLSCVSVQYSSTLNDTNYILCTTRCSQVNLFFNDLLNLPEYCRDESAQDYALTCSVTYHIHFDRQYISLNFTASNNTDYLDGQTSKEILTQTTKLNFNAHPGYDSYDILRKYTCNTDKDCARVFYENTISFLVNDGKATLDILKEKLYNESVIVGPTARRHCIDSNKTGNKTSVKCRDGFCYARVEKYDFAQEKSTKTQKCERTHQSYLLSEIERHKPTSTQEKEVLEYSCNKHVCNRNDLIPKIQTLMNDYIRWNPARDVEEDTASPLPDTMEKAGNSFSLPQTMSSSILVSFVIVLQFFI
ncbi:unnamed protein product [Adineta ricciae]|uniref:Uncharacterized protein n=1 Tax=Adineta ricciae TaxID=249248 RepID=A0A816ENH7_ADIRI|nr:unnamed protein product [Adineta ricciae]